MVFQQVYGAKYTVTVLGFPSSTFSVDGGSPISLDANGEATIEIRNGRHTFTDGYVASNAKTVVITGNSTIPLGVYIGTLSTSTSRKGDRDTSTSATDADSVTKTLPTGRYTHIIGSLYGRLWQTMSGTGWANPRPSSSLKVGLSSSGIISADIYSASGYLSISRIADGGWVQDVNKTISIDKAISTTGGADVTVSLSETASQGGGNGGVTTKSSVEFSDVYIY